MSLDPTQIILEPNYHGDQRDRLPVIGSSGITPINGNKTLNAGADWPAIPARELFLTNDDAGDISIIINGPGGSLGWVLHGGETFNERVPPFTSIIVSSPGLWRWYVRGNLT